MVKAAPKPDVLRIMAWNIRHGGRSGIPAIVERIAGHAPDVAVISEYRCNHAGDKLRTGLSETGLSEFRFIPAPSRLNGVLIAARSSATAAQSIAFGLEKPHALVQTEIAGISIVGVYMPNGVAKTPYWEAVVNYASSQAATQTLFIGDFNTGRHFEDERGATLVSAPFMDVMEEKGFIEVWRQRNPEAREFTWLSPRGNGFRLDHAFASASLNERIIDVAYSHDERLQRISDHSAMIVDISTEIHPR